MDSDPIGELAARARALAAAGDLSGAAALLGPALSTQDIDPAAATVPVAEAAAVYAGVLSGLHETAVAQSWAAYAHTASLRLHGPADERTLAAAATLATVLHRAGALHRAAHLYQELADRLAEADGPHSARALAARADLATVLHARGECRHARRLLHDTWVTHGARYGEADPAGIKMLARLGSMERACGDLDGGTARLAEALRLSRTYLGEAHPLTAQVAGLAGAPPDTGHMCTAPELPTTDAASPNGARTGPPPDIEPDELDEPWWPEDAFAPTQPPAPTPEPDPMVWTAEPPRQITDEPPPPRFARLRSASGNPVAVGLVAVIAGALAAAGVGYAMTARNDRASTADLPPRVPSAAPTTAAPAPTRRPPPTPAPATAGPPTAVKLTDRRDSVTVSWKYPPGAEGPVVISGGRAGQPMQAFATLPAGSTRYTVYGLASSLNYCFRVAVAHSTDVVARANPVCTHRRR